MKKITFLLGVLLITLTSSNPMRVLEIKGTVFDENGMGLPGASVIVKGTATGATTNSDGKYQLKVPSKESILLVSFVGYVHQEIKVGEKTVVNVHMQSDMQQLEKIVVIGYGTQQKSELTGSVNRMLNGRVAGVSVKKGRKDKRNNRVAQYPVYSSFIADYNTESYSGYEENTFQSPWKEPLSTFSIDVDAASYSNVRRFINNGSLPPKDAIRVEEMINYFQYEYNEPKGDDPFSINTEIVSAPWNEKHKLVQIGLQGKRIDADDLPASNLVFLLDVSGSMNQSNKLPLLKKAFKLLANELREEDKVSIVVYAGAAGTVLEPTSGNNKNKIFNALDQLQAGGSTAGGAGIKLAYKIAKQNFVDKGNNRIIIATDGDFNVGASSDKDMEELVEEKRKEGVFLTVLGFGMGNYKDSKMELLADKGNGNYAYIDNILEAKKVLVNEFGGTMHTIAMDVKLQVEFNPAKVQAYRLIGYENRVLAAEDFNDDKKDAGELGSGHTVTALYEVVPVGVKSDYHKSVDELKYQKGNKKEQVAVSGSDELLTVKFRYKAPNGEKSKLLIKSVNDQIDQDISENMLWSSAVAQFGMILTDSPYKHNSNYDDVLKMAKNSVGDDQHGYRQEFIKMVKSAKLLRELE